MLSQHIGNASVAQLDRASASEAEGRWFDSSQAHRITARLNSAVTSSVGCVSTAPTFTVLSPGRVTHA